MWSSVKKILLPNSFEEALQNQTEKNSAFFSGGTYLVPLKNKSINKLIDINKLTDNEIAIENDKITIGAGTTIQDIVDRKKQLIRLSEVAKLSNFSKNIRNQRTIGGEIAQKPVQSDIFTYLIALNPRLEIRRPEKKLITMREWDGKGIINKLILTRSDLESSGFERFSVIPSAPAFLMVAIARKALELDIVVSGNVRKVFGHTMKLSEFGKNTIKEIIDESVKYFKEDQYGTIEYKKTLVATGIQRTVGQI